MKRVLGEGWALPTLDGLNDDFFTAGVLTLQQCAKCGNIQHPPEEVCTACQNFELRAFASAGTGQVESVVVVRQSVHPLLADQIPYAIVLVSVDDAPGIVVVGNVADADPDTIAIGDRVRVVFEEVTDPKTNIELRIPQWELVSR